LDTNAKLVLLWFSWVCLTLVIIGVAASYRYFRALRKRPRSDIVFTAMVFVIGLLCIAWGALSPAGRADYQFLTNSMGDAGVRGFGKRDAVAIRVFDHHDLHLAVHDRLAGIDP
jgi:hypothetical protein